MLVLTRKIGESIVIGDNIVVEILDVAPGKIRIGIAAPTDIRVVRGELIPHKVPQDQVPQDQTGRPGQDGKPGDLVPAGPTDAGAANPRLSAVRTVADIARFRLRQIREQIATRKSSSEVAETGTKYLIDSGFQVEGSNYRAANHRGLNHSGLIPSGLIPSGLIRSGLIRSGLIRSGLIPSGLIPAVASSLVDANMGKKRSLDDSLSDDSAFSGDEAMSFEAMSFEAMSFEANWRGEGLSQYPNRPSWDIEPTQDSLLHPANLSYLVVGTVGARVSDESERNVF